MAETITTKHGSVYTDTPCGRTICSAENALGPLSMGRKVDLLLDNHAEIADSKESRALVTLVTVSAIEPCAYCGKPQNSTNGARYCDTRCEDLAAGREPYTPSDSDRSTQRAEAGYAE